VTITTSNGGAIDMSSTDNSSISGSASPAKFTAGAQAGTATITVETGDNCRSVSKTFTIVAPTVDYYNANNNVAHNQGLADIGRLSDVYLGPSTVNFTNVWFVELSGTASGTGAWYCNNTHNPNPPVQASATYDATKGWLTGYDQGAEGSCDRTPDSPTQFLQSTATVTIPTQYSVNGAAYYGMNPVTMSATDSNGGNLTIKKDQMNGSTTVDSPTVGYQ
jgi:hypothetical protein